MNQPTPAIVSQEAVRRLPRIALFLFCIAYVVPGFIGREPWKNADIAGFGQMFELVHGHASWLAPTMLGQPPEFDALFPYWLGALAIQVAPAGIGPDLAVRCVFSLLLALTLTATWYAVYWLARSARAQPVPFAFGGEASPIDYARAIADGGLLALIACLGLAQFSHETTPAVAQVAFVSLAFFAMAALPYRLWVGGACLVASLAGMALSGAPTMAMLFAAGGLGVAIADRANDGDEGETPALHVAIVYVIALAVTAALSFGLDLWHWRVVSHTAAQWRALVRLLLWFTWPAWPLVLWTLWRWRRQLLSRHVALPLWLAIVALVTTWATPSSDRSLLLALPALAALAAFSLPTLSRPVSALIDWFTLLFFSGCAFAIWVIWLSIQFGIPAKPAQNIARLAPGFHASFSVGALVAALAATVAWGWLVVWRTGRNRSAIWKSLVLPAGGVALSWLLVMTLGLPILDYARGYSPLVRAVKGHMDAPGCVEVLGLSRAQQAAFRYHGNMDLRNASFEGKCPWLLANDEMRPALPITVDIREWRQVAKIRRPSDSNEDVFLYKRAPRP